MTRRSLLIYGLLAAAWVLVMGWLAAEHYRVRKSARAALINRAKDISTTCGVVVRSQRRFGVISKERLEPALADLIKSGEITAIALLNASGDTVASAGSSIDPHVKEAARLEPLWEEHSVTLVNLVDLGTNVTGSVSGTNPPIVVSTENLFRGDSNRPPREMRPPSDDTNAPPREMRPPPGATNAVPDGTNAPSGSGRSWRGGWSDGRPRFSRPPWMSEEEYKAILPKQGVHSFLLVLSTAPVREICRQDLLLRSIIGILATLSVIGSGLTWRNLTKTSELQIRLVRARELNTHLKEMNLAAAGLAHETRNPLNIIRGVAQMISKQDDAPPAVRQKSAQIIEEADRVTAQLNEFINYSRPREVRRTAVALSTVVGEVVRALGCDLEEKNIRLQRDDAPVIIEADEQLLRQALFNLLLNAVQAVGVGGEIQVVAQKHNATGVVLEIRDNGPGVAPERRAEIFKPYVTTNQKGTGLGLAVVQQIVLAHGWEIECLPNEPRGAIFRLSHLKQANAKA